jgi:hypothetical protein
VALQPDHTLFLHSWWGIPVVPQAFAFWRPSTVDGGNRFGYAFAWAFGNRLRSFRFDYASGRLDAHIKAEVPAIERGGNLVLSAQGDREGSGLLWAATQSTTAPPPAGHLWALDPVTLKVLWRGDTPAWSKFTPPTVVRGRVYLPSTSNHQPTSGQVMVYGL